MNGRIKDEDIDEVRERSNIVEVISEYLTLKKAGKTYKALCPFHKEKTPSFIVDPQKQLYHCFGCGEGGNAYTFVMKMDNLDFPEAVKSLAKRCGYHLRIETSKEAKEKASLTSRIYEAYKETKLFYQGVLASEVGKAARSYLKERGYTLETVKSYELGLAPENWDGLLRHLYKRGFSTEELEKAGLAVRGEGGSFYDRFRKRLMFPIWDLKGRVVAFGGRSLKGEEPKYLNSPETPIFYKSKLVYGLPQAKDRIVKSGEALVVEGYTDVISLHQAGIKNAVASLGTALTPGHIHLLGRFTENVKLIFDADVAGKKAAERGLELLGESKVEISVVTLPQGSDPADLVAKGGRDEFEKHLTGSLPIVDFCVEEVISEYDLKDLRGRIKAARAALPIIASLTSFVAKEGYLKKLSEKLDVSLDVLSIELKEFEESKKKGGTGFFKDSQDVSLSRGVLGRDAQAIAEKEIVKLLLLDADILKKSADGIKEKYFTIFEYKELFLALKSQAARRRDFNPANLINYLDDKRLKSLVSQLVLEPITVEDTDSYFQDILIKLKELSIQRQINNLKTKLESLNVDKDTKSQDELFEKILALEEEKRNLRLQVS